jgi:predicted RNA methylase
VELTPAERAAKEAAAARDAALAVGRRKREGIVHTPPELARFVANAADRLLRGTLGIAHGLAGDNVAIIDPACGPGAFLAAALAVKAGQGGAPRAVLGVDRDALAVESAHAAMSLALTDAGWPCALQQRDTLRDLRPPEVAGLAPVLCVIGNPPWVGSAQERAEPWLDALLDDFRRDAEGGSLGERKIGVLSDAYVRFVRWACEVARCAEQGAVVALVTNGSYLDGPVHRGMRAALRREFDALHILDLGGNALVARTGERDGNVFGVRTSVAVLLAVRGPVRVAHTLAPVRYLRLLGAPEHKLDQLASLTIDDASFCTLELDARYQRFVPTPAAHADYARWPSLAELMPFHREGVQTNRDDVLVDTDRERLLGRLRAFANGDDSPALGSLLRPLAHYQPERAREALRDVLQRDPDGTRGLLVRPVAYRPFDNRFFSPVAALCHRPRPALLAAIDGSTFALVTVRKERGDTPWAHFGAACDVIDNCLLSTRSSCRARAFPTHDAFGRENIDQAKAEPFAERIGRRLGSVELAHYVLAVLSSPSYRARNDMALRIDYPRIPPPADLAEFDALGMKGERLAALFCAPFGGAAEHASGDVTYDQVEFDAHSGEVCVDREVIAVLSDAARGLRIGRHRPLHSFLHARAGSPVDLPTLRALCERLSSLAQLCGPNDDPYSTAL